jgi:hypothetical protein
VLSDLGPLGTSAAGSVLLILGLRLWLSERKSWVRERREMQEQHQKELDRRDARIQYLEERLDGRTSREEF